MAVMDLEAPWFFQNTSSKQMPAADCIAEHLVSSLSASPDPRLIIESYTPGEILLV